MNIIYTNGGTDFSSLRPIIFVNPNGFQVNLDGSLGPQIVDTKNGTDFSSVYVATLVDIDGNN